MLHIITRSLAIAAISTALIHLPVVRAEDKPAAPPAGPIEVKHQITGLFSKDREADLRATFDKIPELALVSVSFEQAEVVLRYDHQKLFKGVKPEEVIKRLDNTVRSNSHSTFGIKPLREKPLDQLTLVEIDVVGLDCKGCCWAAYQAISRMDGVERATASFKEGKVTAHIDPAKTNREALEAALKQRQVTLKSDVAKP